MVVRVFPVWKLYKFLRSYYVYQIELSMCDGQVFLCIYSIDLGAKYLLRGGDHLEFAGGITVLGYINII